MFTGMVQQVGVVRQVRPTSGGRRLTIDLGPLAEGLDLGDSVAVRGACLTVCAIAGTVGDFDVVSETLDRTTLCRLRSGAKVNLERALRLGDGLDGHLVQGHVDGVAAVRKIATGGRHEVSFATEPSLTGQMVSKGSVCIDGVSLTLTDVRADAFAVALIPTTLADTTLGELAVGDEVNVETDLIGKYVAKYLAALGGGQSGGVTLAKLRDAGFM